MKTKRMISRFFIFTFLFLFFFGITLFVLGNNNSSKKFFFRKTYGFIGISKDINNLQLYAFNIGNNNSNSLINANDVFFDNNDVDIKKIDVGLNNKIRNIEYLSLFLTIEMKEKNAILKGIFIKENYYSIGEINLMSVDKALIVNDHGINSSFFPDSIYKIIFGNKNKSAFFVNNVFFENMKIKEKQINTKLPAKYNMNESLEIEIKIDFEIDNNDIFIIQPIFEIEILNEEKGIFFIPMMPTKNEKSLDYFEIIEYIKNAKN